MTPDLALDDDSVRVICNANIYDKKMLDIIRPDMLAVVDTFYFFGPSVYSREYLNNMVWLIREYGCYLLVSEKTTPLILGHFPDLETRIIGIPCRFKGEINFPDERNFYVKMIGNILIDFILPVVSAISDDIYIIGADGEQKKSTQSWGYYKAAKHDDSVQSVIDTHPGWFNNTIYDRKYKIFCQGLEKFIVYGESAGKHYTPLTPSLIPVLKSRSIKK